MKTGYYGIIVAWLINLVILMKAIQIQDWFLIGSLFLALLILTFLIVNFFKYKIKQRNNHNKEEKNGK